jgi:hypothetical protein
MPITIPRSVLGAAIAASLLLASPALAKPMDPDHRAEAPTSSLAGTVTAKQDLRGEHARDAARTITHAAPAGPKQDLRGEHARDASRPPVAPAAPPVASAPKALPAADDNGSRPDTWLLVVIGLAGAVIVAAGTSGLVRARRTA